ncbi:hypothetical protein MNBD_GAMMA13-242 [hydrothermal vent metagenome]|uniref:DUF1022 domain-containing protein n=1 Tax=hydrothermal vent metagenome TaxID=652676 RepID=A0A3B0YGX8_9ZZZZ
MPVTSLRVWVLSDNQPGHYNVSRGIVAALKRTRSVEEYWLPMQLRFGAARNLLRFGLNHMSSVPNPKHLKLFYAMPTLPEQGCDLIVSTGGKTSFANAWLSKSLSVPNLFSGSLRRLSPEHFTVLLTLGTVAPTAAANLLLELPPSAIDRSVLDSQGNKLRQDMHLHDQRIYTLLIGGDGAGYQYADHDWQQLGELLNVLGERYQARWLLMGSRRSGVVARRILEATVKPALIANSVWYEKDKPVDIAAYLGAAEQIFVTEDSMTMLTEAIYSQRPVISLRPASVVPSQRYEAMVQRFSDLRWICRFELSTLLADPEQVAVQHCQPLRESPLDSLAIQLESRLFHRNGYG